jgi:hypothetical protein
MPRGTNPFDDAELYESITNPKESNLEPPKNNNSDFILSETQQSFNQKKQETPIIVGYMNHPARIDIYIHTEGTGTIIRNNVQVQDINFLCPKIDLTPIVQDIKQLKLDIKRLINSKQLAQDIGNELVGETYLRWDTQVRFYPTITFIFLENEAHFITENQFTKRDRKKVQIKLRLTLYKSELLEQDASYLDQICQDLKQKILLQVDTLHFYTGNIRCNYVNQGNISWKTTIFAFNEQEAINIMQKLSSLIGETFYSNYFTFNTLRNTSVNTPIPVYLHKTSLLINKIGHPILLYHV